MRIRSRKSSIAFVTGLGLMALLPLLAVLQYRWLGEISQAEREKMKQDLAVGADRFQHDLNREVTRAYVLFQVHFGDQREVLPDLGARYRRWESESPYPDLLSDIYWSRPADKPGDTGLFRLDKSTGRLEPVDWPGELVEFKPINDGETGGSAAYLLRGQVIRTVNGNVPVMKIPSTSSRSLKDLNVSTATFEDSSTIVTLNLDYLQNRLLPRLTERYFSSGGRLDYNLLVVPSNKPDDVIYRSDANLAASDLSNPDVKEGVLGMTMNDLQDLVKIVHPDGAGKAEPIGNTVIGTATPYTQEKTTSQDKSDSLAQNADKPVIALRGLPKDIEFRSTMVSAGTQTDSGGTRTKTRLTLYALSQGSPSQPFGPNSWVLMAKNRAGSLEAAVTVTRRRNLAISFGILALLAASVVLVAVSSLRASQIARRQMEFVAGVSHEFRTPLSVISSAAQNLADGVVDDPAQARRYGELIESESARLTGMVEQVLELAGAQSGRNNFDPRPLRIEEVVSDAIAATQSLIEETHFVVDTKIASDLPPVIADRDGLSRSIQNLIHNAIKYGAESGWIGITAVPGESSGHKEVVVTVEDRGIGISAADLPNIFRPFYRAREVVDAQIHGSGLGLSLVKNAIEAAGGKVRVESSPGRGSSFALHLLADFPAES